ncbi:hypothetical protein C8F04DRAFT_1198460 [Mycena alexandri]|uniref:Uncharacterized protein n=1 Tax=Mycena alexandri TaxID=1745969 RepID=A0AAD6WLL9_9AGAR|nr:hypothetical protein C8F04DRAFT_1198460 [Mycena alexandri]
MPAQPSSKLKKAVPNPSNLEEEREKARNRMARLREKVSNDKKHAEEARARARAASRTYRERHASALAHRQRIIRMEAYGKKYGHRAWLERRQQLEARRAEAQERTDFARYEAEYQMRLQQQHSGTST